MNTWKLLVERLGKIERAEVEVRPLMLFVGDNNSGKSYLVSLLWGLLSLSGNLPLSQGDAYHRCAAWLEERFARREEEPEFEVTPEVHADLVQIMNDTLREHGSLLAERTFNRPGFKVGKVELDNVGYRKGLRLCWRTETGPVKEPRPRARGAKNAAPRVDFLSMEPLDGPWSSVGIQLQIRASNAEQRAHGIAYLIQSQVLDTFAVMAGWRERGAMFLPASRTGFMLLYRSLAQQLVGDALRKTNEPRASIPGLTAPAIDFVKQLLGLYQSKGRFPEEATTLERAMGGRLSIQMAGSLNEVLYEHAEGQPPLPMELASSLVTELAPIVLTLRHHFDYPVLIIEEPEAHLHPHLQRTLAQVIVRLIRKGLHVWITTHSENFCQQINNFMKIGAAPDRARLNVEMQKALGHAYGDQDYLTPDDVAGYEFVNQNNRSLVRRLEAHPDGLVMPTFNREMVALGREVTFLEQHLGEGA